MNNDQRRSVRVLVFGASLGSVSLNSRCVSMVTMMSEAGKAETALLDGEAAVGETVPLMMAKRPSVSATASDRA